MDDLVAPEIRVATRRPYGTGQLFVKAGSWYGRWWAGDRRIKRKLGPVRAPGTSEGLTRAQAERELRRRIDTERPSVPAHHGLTVEQAAERLIDHLEALARKPTTIGIYRSLARTHLAVHLADKPLDTVTPENIEGLMAAMRRDGARPKTALNALTLLHQVFGRRKGWCSANPCSLVDRPRVEDAQDIRYLDMDEVEALLRSVPDNTLGGTDRALYLTATMTGLRQGELLALRWRDIDWTAGRVRVRRNYVRGHWGTPKSRRSTRAVPLADRLAGELERHYQRSAYQADDDLVFCHPHTGSVLDHSDLVRRFKKALKAAGVREVRFHDLRHTFGTRMAAAGVPLRTLQAWLGHRDFKTTLRYADYSPSAHEAAMVERAFDQRGPMLGPNLSETERNSEALAGTDTGV